MTKILNLDSFENPDEKAVVLNGVSHAFAPFTVEQFIAQMKDVEALEKQGDMTLSQFTEYSIDSIVRAYPTIPRDELFELPMHKLNALLKFVRGVAEEEAAQAGTDEGNAAGTSS